MLILAACATSSTVPDPRGPELPPAVITNPTGSDVRTAPGERGVQEEFAATAERVWAALTEVWGDLELQPDALDTRTRTIGVQRFTRSRIAGQNSGSFVRCGNEGAGPSASSRYRTSLDLRSQVHVRDDKVFVHTMLTGTASPVDGSSTSRVGCMSLGLLEQRIHDAIARKLGPAR